MANKRGHELPLFDNTGQPDLFSSVPAPEIAPTAPPSFETKIPVDVAGPIRRQKAEDDREWDRLDSQGIHTGRTIRQRIGETALTPEDIERKEAAGSVKQARKTSRRKPRALGPRQQNIADGDKRVEAAYGKPGEII